MKQLRNLSTCNPNSLFIHFLSSVAARTVDPLLFQYLMIDQYDQYYYI